MNQCISTTKRAVNCSEVPLNCGKMPLVKIIKGGEQKC